MQSLIERNNLTYRPVSRIHRFFQYNKMSMQTIVFNKSTMLSAYTISSYLGLCISIQESDLDCIKFDYLMLLLMLFLTFPRRM